MDTAADPTKTTTNPGHEGHRVHLCSKCGWPFPNAHPSARHRRKHRRVCGTVEGYILETNSTSAALGHSHSQHSAVSSFSDDEHGSDGNSKASSAKGVMGRSISQGGGGLVLETRNMSADDVFADAVSEFVDAGASLAGDEGFSVSTETITHEVSGIPGFTPPVEDVAVTEGILQASINRANSNESLREGTTTSLNQEQLMSFSEISAKVDDAKTVTSEESKRLYAFENPDGSENDFKKIYDASEVNSAPVIVAMCKDANESSEAVTEEEMKSQNEVVTEVDSEFSQNEEKRDVKSGSETFMVDHFQEGETVVRSSDEISGFKSEEIPQIKFDELSTELAVESSARASHVSWVVDVPSITESDHVVLVDKQTVESICEIEEDIISYGLSVDDTGTLRPAVEIETLETSVAHDGSGLQSEDSNNDQNSLTRASLNDDTKTISTTDENGQAALIVRNSNMLIPEDGYNNVGNVAEAFDDKVEGNVLENETKSDHPSPNIISEEPVSRPAVALVQSAENSSEYESSLTDRAVKPSSDANSSLCDKFIHNTTGVTKEVKSDDVDGSDTASAAKPISHNVLLQKLEEDLSDDEPVKSFTATESSSQSLGIDQVDDGGVICKDSSAKDIEQSQDHYKEGVAISVVDAPYEISSPNGSSVDGNWGSVSVLSTMSDAAGDVKKKREAQDGQSDDKHNMFDPPPQAQNAVAASSTSGEAQNPQQTEAARLPSISSGRKKNEEIIEKVTNWSTGKQHSTFKTLLSEAKADSPNPNPNPSAALPNDKTTVKNSTPAAPTVNSILGSEEPKDKLDTSSKEWTAGCPDEIKREKRKAKGRPYWVPFMCCSSVSSVK